MLDHAFVGHGTYQLQHEHNIVIFAGQGAWNVEASRAAIAEITQVVDSFSGQPHAFIFDTFEMEGMTPECYQAWSDAVSYWLKKGSEALVRMDDLGSMHYKLYFEVFDIPLRELIAYHHTDTTKKALEWLHELGYKGFDA